MFSRDPKPKLLRITNKQSIPAALTLTGTVSSSGTLVTGVGTLFLSEIENPKIRHRALKYKYIFDANQAVVREIDHVLTNTSLVLKEAFPGNMASQALQVPDTSIEYQSVSIISLGTGNYVQGTIVQSGSVINRNVERDGIFPPIGVDGTPAGLQVDVIQ